MLALRDHFASSYRRTLVVHQTALTEIRTIVDESNSEPDAQKISDVVTVATNVTPGLRPEDAWTLEYISIFRIQPLIEAFDADASSFVTIAEANNFTAECPENWRQVWH